MNNQIQNNTNEQYEETINDNKIYKKNNKKLVIAIIIGIICVIIVGGIILKNLFTLSTQQIPVYQSGEVEIMGKKIILPCSSYTLEKTLNSTILKDENFDGIVKIPVDYNNELILTLNIEDDTVKGISVEAISSYASEFEIISFENKRSVANKVIFPGKITTDSNIDDVKETYKTTPLNVWYINSSEVIREKTATDDGWLSSNYHYNNGEWEIQIHTRTNIRKQKEEITSIDYWYLK